MQWKWTYQVSITNKYLKVTSTYWSMREHSDVDNVFTGLPLNLTPLGDTTLSTNLLCHDLRASVGF
jgi:hypothetical protein